MESIYIMQDVKKGKFKGCTTIVEKNSDRKWYYRKIVNVSNEFVMDADLNYGSHTFMQIYCNRKSEDHNQEESFNDFATPLKNLTEWIEGYIEEIKSRKRINKTKARLQKYAERILNKLKNEDQELLILVG